MRQKYFLSEFPKIPIRQLPSTYEELNLFFHEINPLCNSIHCEDTDCAGYINRLPIRFEKKTSHCVKARCRACRCAINWLPSNYIQNIIPKS